MSATATIAPPTAVLAAVQAGAPVPGAYVPPANAPVPQEPQPYVAQPPAHFPQLPQHSAPVQPQQNVPVFPAFPVQAQPQGQPQPAQPVPQAQPAAPTAPNIPDIPGKKAAPTQPASSPALAGITDPTLRSLGTLITTAVPDIDVDRALGKALEEGREDLIDLAYIREKAGDQAGAVEALAKQILHAAQAVATATANQVYATAGGEAQWKAAVAAFNAGAPAHIKAAAKALLDSPEGAVQGAQLVVEFARGSGAVISGPGAHISSSAPGTTGAGLDKATFQAELRKLDPNSPTFAAARNELIERRRAGMASGL